MPMYDIMQYEGPSDILVWKHRREDFSTNTQLIVHESQEALFFMNGQALDLFGPGRHNLETQNIPLLSRLAGALLGTDGKKPFHCQVYFINRAVVMDMLWGTNAPIQYQDPALYGILVPVRANGQYAVQVQDSRKLLVKMVGTVSMLSTEELARYFKGEFMMQIKTVLSRTMHGNGLSILEINSHLVDMAREIQRQLSPFFEEYGLSLKRFQINSVTVPEDDPSYDKIKRARAEAGFRSAQGYSYHDERRYDIAQTAAANEGAARAGAAFCTQCGGAVKAEDNFCAKCGAKVNRGDA